MAKKTKQKKSPPRKVRAAHRPELPTKLRPGLTVWFEDVDGAVHQGIYRGHRRVEEHTAINTLTAPGGDGKDRHAASEHLTTTWTVPAGTEIHIGVAPEVPF